MLPFKHASLPNARRIFQGSTYALFCLPPSQMLEVMMNDEYALVLSPQSFHNVDRESDLFNNINKQFWYVAARLGMGWQWPDGRT